MTRAPASPRIALLAAAVDTVLVLVFVLIGRSSHEEGFSLLGSLDTAWPFVAGLAVGWIISRAWRAPLSFRRTALPVWHPQLWSAWHSGRSAARGSPCRS